MTALSASNLRAEDHTVLQSVPHHVIAFSWRTSPVRVFLNAETGVPTAVEWVSANPYSSFWRTWGDVTTRVYYSFWWLAAEGIHYPLQWDIVKNGMADHAELRADGGEQESLLAERPELGSNLAERKVGLTWLEKVTRRGFINVTILR